MHFEWIINQNGKGLERFEQSFPVQNSLVQEQLNSLAEHAQQNKMRLNHSKTKIMLFNSAKKYDFQPELSVEGVNLEVVKKMKLLGVIVAAEKIKEAWSFKGSPL